MMSRCRCLAGPFIPIVFLTIIFVTDGVLAGRNRPGIHLQAASLEYTNPTFVGDGAFVKITKTARQSEPTLNAMFPFIVNLPGTTNMTFMALQKVQNIWKTTAFRGSVTFCEILSPQVKVMRLMIDYSNFPKECPVEKGNYTISEWTLKEAKRYGMPMVPPGEWRTRLGWTDRKTKILSFTFDSKIEI